MAMIFCPTMELKRDATSTRYSSIVAGLGWDAHRKKPIYEENDLTFNLDVEITPDDIEKVI